jgi:hypothetical protein
MGKRKFNHKGIDPFVIYDLGPIVNHITLSAFSNKQAVYANTKQLL